MKKLLGIVVLGLLLSGCDNLGDKNHIKFDKCWNIEEYQNFNDANKSDDIYKEWFFEIDLEKETVTRTSIYYDKYYKMNKERYNLKKVNLKTYSIKSATKNFVETNYISGSSYLFNLKNGELVLNHKMSEIPSTNFNCDKF
jgi:hypothetical protein